MTIIIVSVLIALFAEQLETHRSLRCLHFLMPFPSLHQLLSKQRDQNANDDDRHLARDFAPAMQRLG
jgi:hypothetical protein